MYGEGRGLRGRMRVSLSALGSGCGIEQRLDAVGGSFRSSSCCAAVSEERKRARKEKAREVLV